MTSTRTRLGRGAIEQVIPHREPLLLVDEVCELVPGVAATALKRVDEGDPALAGGWADGPALPPTLLLEAMAQAGAVALLSPPEHRGRMPLLAGIEHASIHRPPRAGELVELSCRLERIAGSAVRGRAWASVEGVPAAEATFVFTLGRG